MRLKRISSTSLPQAPAPSTEPPLVGRLPHLPLGRISTSPTQAPLSKVRALQPSTRDKILCFDLENRPLAYWYDGMCTSEITAFGWKWHHYHEVHTMLLTNDGHFEDDLGIRWPSATAHETFSTILQSADIVYGHNIRRHDLPIIQAHLLRLHLPPLGELTTTDTLRDYPKRGGMSASLANLAAYYGLEGEKKVMTQNDWEDANRLTSSGIPLARERVVGDVLLQERLRDKLLELEILKAPRTWRG